jgi:oligoendopeptidase F
MEKAKGKRLKTPPLKDRDRVDAKYRWDRSHIFASVEDWEEAGRILEGRLCEIEQLRGSLAEGPAALLAVLELEDRIGQEAYKVWFHALLAYDERRRDNILEARYQKAKSLMVRETQASAWFRPELVALGWERVEEWLLADDEGLGRYRFMLSEIFRQEDHVLDEAGEALLALGARLATAPADAYTALTVADFVHPRIFLADGTKVQITPAQYRSVMVRNRNREDRRRAFEAHYGLYQSHRNACASLYSGVCQNDLFQARARKFPSTLEQALSHDHVPVEVVENLIASARGGAEPLRRYHRLRRKVLGLESYDLYDSLLPLLDIDSVYDYDRAVELVVASVSPLGNDYRDRMRQAVEGRWIDVYEGDGKRGGAYSASVYGVHPYLLLNYNDTLSAVFTLAHELGHCLHSMLSSESQPFVYARYSIFVAEVASTLGEALLLDHLLKETEDPGQRALLLQHAIDSTVGTFYSQAMFAEFELRAHREVEAERPLTSDALNDLYGSILEDYVGDTADRDDLYRLTWARIPHFFRSPFYVYQYATSFAASALLAQEILQGEEAEREAAVTRFLEMLSAGGSDHPIRLLDRAGVDLSRPEPVQALTARTDALVNRLEEALGELGVI